MSDFEILPFEASRQKEVEQLFVDGLTKQEPKSLQRWFVKQKLNADMGDIQKHYIDEKNGNNSGLSDSYGGLWFWIAVTGDGRLAGCVAMMKSSYGEYSDQEKMYHDLPEGPNALCELVRMSVHPNFRGQALGPRLVKVVEDEAKKRGYKRLAISTLLCMKPAIRLYERCGYAFVKDETIDLTARMGPLDPETGKPWEEVKIYHMMKDL